MIRRPPRSTLFPTRRSSDLKPGDLGRECTGAGGLAAKAGVASGGVSASLRAVRARAAAQVAALEAQFASLVAASEDSNADDEHDPEGATIGFERAQLTAVLDAARERLRELDLALARAGSDAYGVCERCGSAIGDERRAPLPATRLCIA